MNHSIAPLAALSIMTDNVLRKNNRSSALSSTIQKGINVFSPATINLQEVAGDFNSVIELSADLCLKVFDLDFQRSILQTTIEPDDLKTFFDSQTADFDSPYLNQLAATDPTKTTYVNGIPIPPKGLSLLLFFAPKSLSFGNNNTLEITYLVSVVVGSLFPKLEKSDALGNFSVVISAGWNAVPYAGPKQLDVFVDLTSAMVSITPEVSDAKRMYDAGLFGTDGKTITAFLLQRKQVRLIPTISLVGKDGTNADVPELPDFDAQVAVVEWLGLQALVAAFRVNPECASDIEDIQHFIGFSDYGVISDEAVISGLINHKWNLGGFLRAIPWHADVQVKVNGDVENATLYGTMKFETLDSVILDTDSNSASDCIALSGTASVYAQYLLMPDKTMVTAEGVDFGPPEKTGWAFRSSPAVQAQLPQAAAARAFTMQAYQDAYRHLGRPFARFPDPVGNARDPLHIDYVRTDAVAQRMFSLASVSETFI